MTTTTGSPKGTEQSSGSSSLSGPGPSDDGSLRAAKLAVMREVPYIQKTKSPGLQYTFASETELIQKLRPSMVRHGITCRPKRMELLGSGEYKTAKGAAMRFVSILATYEFSRGSEAEEAQVFGEAADVSDKALPKAMTLAHKYALRQYFCIETGDDPDLVAHLRGTPEEGGGAERAARQVLHPRNQNPTSLDEIASKVRRQFTGETLDKLLTLIARQRGGLSHPTSR